MRSLLLTVLIFSASAILNVAHLAAGQVEKPRYRKAYHTLKDGNELYAQCLVAQEHVKPAVDGQMTIAAGPEDSFEAGTCLGYINGVVDSIPTEDGDFDPAPKVRLTQYADVVIRCLREKPESRQDMAYILTRICLSEAFPMRKK
jgi:Rap1a immunity proteins